MSNGKKFYLNPVQFDELKKSYKLENPLFPDQPTSDQLFDESQFAACRDLGYNITNGMIKNCDLDPLENSAGF